MVQRPVDGPPARPGFAARVGFVAGLVVLTETMI
jgi:hypothetical protein